MQQQQQRERERERERESKLGDWSSMLERSDRGGGGVRPGGCSEEDGRRRPRAVELEER